MRRPTIAVMFASSKTDGTLNMQTGRRCCSWVTLCGQSTRHAVHWAKNQEGPFYQFLTDRKKKGFTAILISYLRGFGDTPNEKAGHRNEGGYPFVDGNISRVNSAYFQFLDVRMQALWDHGFVCAVHPTWFGKRRQCFFDMEWARHISAYLAVRYGAFNAVWSLSGEYQGGMRDCDWSTGDINKIGETVQTYNPYSHPLSIHPGSAYFPGDPHRQQSSDQVFGLAHILLLAQLEDGRIIKTDLAPAVFASFPMIDQESFFPVPERIPSVGLGDDLQEITLTFDKTYPMPAR